MVQVWSRFFELYNGALQTVWQGMMLSKRKKVGLIILNFMTSGIKVNTSFQFNFLYSEPVNGGKVQSGKIFFGHLFLVLTQERERFVITHTVIKVEHNPLFPPPFHYTKREK
jgi:hypothetical protein